MAERVSATPPAGLQTVDRALELLFCFVRRPDANWTLSELAREMGVHKTIVHRLLATFERHDFVRREPETRRYRLGVAAIELGNAAAAGLELREVALPVMRRLTGTTQETTLLSVLSGLEAVCIEKVDSPNPVKVTFQVGRRGPLHAGSTARVLLAFMPPREAAAVLDRLALTRFTEITITDRAALERELEQTRRQGYARSEGELDAGVSAVAAPIWSRGQRLEGGLTLVGPGARFHATTWPAYIEQAVAAAAEISRRLGYRG